MFGAENTRQVREDRRTSDERDQESQSWAMRTMKSQQRHIQFVFFLFELAVKRENANRVPLPLPSVPKEKYEGQCVVCSGALTTSAPTVPSSASTSRLASAVDVTMSVITAQEQGPDGAARWFVPAAESSPSDLCCRVSVSVCVSVFGCSRGSQWVSSKRGFTVAGSHMRALDMLACSALTRHSAQPLASALHCQ